MSKFSDARDELRELSFRVEEFIERWQVRLAPITDAVTVGATLAAKLAGICGALAASFFFLVSFVALTPDGRDRIEELVRNLTLHKMIPDIPVFRGALTCIYCLGALGHNAMAVFEKFLVADWIYLVMGTAAFALTVVGAGAISGWKRLRVAGRVTAQVGSTAVDLLLPAIAITACLLALAYLSALLTVHDDHVVRHVALWWQEELSDSRLARLGTLVALFYGLWLFRLAREDFAARARELGARIERWWRGPGSNVSGE